jgi:replicative DNA helicase
MKQEKRLAGSKRRLRDTPKIERGESIMTEKQRKSLSEYRGDDEIISSHKMAQKLKERKVSVVRVKSLIPSLDALIGEFRDGELIVLSGPTKEGKTTLAQTWTINFAIQHRYALWFSYEVPVRQFLKQFPSIPHFYLPQKLQAHAMDWLKERVYECYLKHKTRIIFIDHLHYLMDLARIKNPSIEIGTVIRQLKRLAVEGGFIIFLIAHTVKGKSEKNLSYESIRDSSFISQESDCVIMIKRTPKVAENAARLRVEFHRRTGVIEKTVDLVKTNGLLTEPKKTPSEPERTIDTQGPSEGKEANA